MGIFADEIMNAASKLNCAANRLSYDIASNVRGLLYHKYTNGSARSPIWEHLGEKVSIQNSNAWTWIDEYLGEKDTVMFFEKYQDDEIIHFEKGSCILPVLKECSGFVFYLTDMNLSFLICFNDHEFLICVGQASDWLKRKILREQS